MSRKVSDEEYGGFIGLMEGSQAGSQNWEMGKTKLTIANMEIQAEASKQLVKSTQELVKATRTLGHFTLALVLVTVVLVIVTGVTIFRNP